jgi:hypothetical protein
MTMMRRMMVMRKMRRVVMMMIEDDIDIDEDATDDIAAVKAAHDQWYELIPVI